MKRLALVTLVLAAACGTTVPVTQQSLSSAGDGLTTTTSGTSTGGTTGDLTTGGATSGTSTGSGSRSSTGSSATVGTSGTTGTTGTTGASALPSSRPLAGGSRSPVEVGLLVVKDLGPAAASLGASGLSTGDGPAQARASIALLNARGGLAGHPVKPVVFEQDATRDAISQYQAACSLFFDDHKVRAVVAWGILPQVQVCAEKRGVPFITSGNRSTAASALDARRLSAVPSQVSLDRMVPAWIASLKSQGYFTPASATEQVKVGLLFNEDPDFAGVPSLVKRALASNGMALGPQQSMPTTDDTSKAPAASSAGSSAALKFASQRVNRVLTVDKSGQALAYFAIAAGSQGYYPTYGLSSLELPNALRTVLSARQLQGARGIGWLPPADRPASGQPPQSANASACLKAMTAAQQDMTSAVTRMSALTICDSVLLLGAAWTDTALSAPAFLSGLAGLGTRYGPVMALADDFSRHRDGASVYRALSYQPGCDCFQYSGAQSRF